MKKIILSFTFLLIFTSLFSQKCRYKTNEIDEFTKKEVIITNERQLTKVGMGLGNFLRFDARSMDGNKYISLLVFGTKAFALEEGSKVMFLTESGEVITLNYNETVIASGNVQQQLNNRIQWTANALLYVNEENYQRLISSDIAKVRWYTSTGYLEEEVNPKHKSHLSFTLSCLQQ